MASQDLAAASSQCHQKNETFGSNRAVILLLEGGTFWVLLRIFLFYLFMSNVQAYVGAHCRVSLYIGVDG